jgi:thymidine kinase
MTARLSPLALRTSGSLTVVVGSMYAGKTEELIRRARRALYAKKKAQVFKHALDTRSEPTEIRTHNGDLLAALPVSGSGELPGMVDPSADLVAVEEAQFFDDGIVDVLQSLADAGHEVPRSRAF